MPSSVVILSVTKFRPGQQTTTFASVIFMERYCNAGSRQLVLAHRFHNGGKLPSERAERFRVARAQSLFLQQLASDAEGYSPCGKKIRRRIESHAAGRHQWNIRQWSLQGANIACSPDLGTWEHLHEIGARFPCRDDFGRCQRA